MRLAAVLLASCLSACSAPQGAARGQNDAGAEAKPSYSAPILAASPRSSGCQDERCAALDAVEAELYELAREKKISWVRLVETFYRKRAEIYPDSRDGYHVNELKAYQRALAEQLDMGLIDESKWVDLLERRYNKHANGN